ncbi:hypothetical protein E4L95_01015 [Paracoccus liaowanqingii]|uniref:Uncharacterized protein n=1 Tax=Paracoccus liaowanqingii TaxID=2560053 RepID=A0A4Z1CST4_9RHOB|nr:hypothetical protein [Paracoccus liaowanqingii]TGN68564.1 hypothetical protein E4L95_01015 [Paracoccus liaowanqingii]
MALSNAEKVRRYRERQKAKRQEQLKQPAPSNDFFRVPFFEFFSENEQISSQYSQSLELAGIDPPIFDNDSGPEATTLDDLSDPQAEGGSINPFGFSAGTSLGRAEVMIGCLLDAASDLAATVNDYKKAEIRARISELETADTPDSEARRAAFAKAAEMTRMLAELDKTVRWPLPVWKVEIKD